jgi:signal transduction histidine kinase
VLRDPKTGLIKEFLAISRDITARKEADQLKDELVSTVSHELRTPLTSLRGFAELMLKKEFPREKQKEFLAIIHNESVRLTNLINDFLDLQRIESGRQEYHFEGCSLPALLHESVAIFSGGKEHRPFHLILPPQLPMVRADRERIQQVLANLFSNAVKFSPEGSAISVGAQVRDGETVVWVKDQGLGIPQEALPKLFSKFFRVDNQDTRTIGGTGLGLALIKKIVEEHTGKVWVESTVGEGSTFFFTLPLAEAEQHETVLL